MASELMTATKRCGEDARREDLEACGRYLAVACDILGDDLPVCLVANYIAWPGHFFAEIGKRLARKCETDEEWCRVVEAGAAIKELPKDQLCMADQGAVQLAMYRERFAIQRERCDG